MERIPSYLLNLAGEYRVCSELNKRGVFATVTYGNRKGADVYAISDRCERALKIEVKTSQMNSFVTSITRKGLAKRRNGPDFWVLFRIELRMDASFKETFFILSDQEICRIQRVRNGRFQKRYFARHGKRFDMRKGVDNVTVDDVKEFEGKWKKIIDGIGGPEVR
jgi:hypothetical protein